jgi:hypothetical protein
VKTSSPNNDSSLRERLHACLLLLYPLVLVSSLSNIEPMHIFMGFMTFACIMVQVRHSKCRMLITGRCVSCKFASDMESCSFIRQIHVANSHTVQEKVSMAVLKHFTLWGVCFYYNRQGLERKRRSSNAV